MPLENTIKKLKAFLHIRE